MSSASVIQLHIDTRRTARPCHREPDIHARPSSRTAETSAAVSSSVGSIAHTWVDQTRLTTVTPSIRDSPSAMATALSCSRSTSSATPCRPSERSAAQVANPRARRDHSGVRAVGSSGDASLAMR